MTSIQEAMKVRQAQANAASRNLDFVTEGSLATFWRQATPGTTYWRGSVPMKYLPGQVRTLETDSLSLDEEQKVLTVKGQEGVPIWQFLGDDARSRIALQLQRQGERTIMEVDDNYLRFAPPLYGKFGAWTKTHEEAQKNGTGYSVEMHRKLVPQMDAIICATENLADEYSRHNDNVFHCPNSVDPSDWAVERTESESLRIGYYGSPSHARDWPLVKKAMKWARKQPGVEVILIGFSPPGWTGKVLPWADDLFSARKNLGHIDVGIAPLTVNPWAVGKSDVKAMEYAMGGVVPLLHDAPPYSPWRQSDWPFMARTEADWFDLIRRVVSEGKDYAVEWAEEAKDYVLRERTIEKNIHRWKEAVDG